MKCPRFDTLERVNILDLNKNSIFFSLVSRWQGDKNQINTLIENYVHYKVDTNTYHVYYDSL
jgi:hypothetical protein